MSSPRVMIIGGGLGGLCLAHGLKKVGMEVTVYERDGSRHARRQGYRIHISPEGSAALHACLPTRLWEILDATVGEFAQGFTIMTEGQQELLCLRGQRERGRDLVRRHRSVSRITLRHILTTGLDDTVRFGSRFLHYEAKSTGITAHFEDGTTAEADMLIGADGVHSRVRAQYLPDADPIDTGVVAVGGTIPLTDHVLCVVPPQLRSGPVMVLPPTACGLFMAMWKRSPESAMRLREIGSPVASEREENYLIFGFGAKREFLGLRADTSEDELRTILSDKMARWHPNFIELLQRIQVGTLSVSPIRTSRTRGPWQASTVTLLGDAIHSMTPYRGIGANIALQDAAVLRSELEAVHAGEKPLLAGVADYEAAMRIYAFKAVNDSRRAMEQFTGPKKQPWFELMKLGMRTANLAIGMRGGLR